MKLMQKLEYIYSLDYNFSSLRRLLSHCKFARTLFFLGNFLICHCFLLVRFPDKLKDIVAEFRGEVL